MSARIRPVETSEGLVTAIHLLIEEWRTLHRIPDDVEAPWSAQVTPNGVTVKVTRKAKGTDHE